MKARAHLYIKGKVQGVFYRAFTQEVADSLGLTGWVRNLPDRKVEAVFEGKRELIEKAVVKCKEGPIYASVTDIEVTWETHLENFSDFTIR